MSGPVVVPSGCPEMGTILDGKYEVVDFIGAGGMGLVLAARHIRLGHVVAIKLLRPEVCRGITIERFLREARATVKMQTEHVARVVDVGELDTGAPYIVMELLVGQNLKQHLEHGGPLSVPLAAQYLMQACEALAEAHSLGWIHRDLKPSNLFLSRHRDGSPQVRVLDFGISKSLVRAVYDLTLTRTGTMLGSPSYMAPEQIRDAKRVDARADIWALGVILYELLTGVNPFEADTMAKLLARIASERVASPRERRPEIPEPLAQLVMQSLEKLPVARIQTIEQFATRLAPFAREQAMVSLPRIAATPPHPAASPREAPSIERNVPSHSVMQGAMSATWRDLVPARRPLRSVVWFAAAIAFGGASLGLHLWRGSGDGSPAPPASSRDVRIVLPADRSAPAARGTSTPPDRTALPLASASPDAAPTPPHALTKPSDRHARPTPGGLERQRDASTAASQSVESTAPPAPRFRRTRSKWKTVCSPEVRRG